MISLRSSLFVSVLCLSLAACGGDDDNNNNNDGGGTQDASGDAGETPCTGPTPEPNYAWIRDNILQKSCADFAACHQGDNPRGRLNLDKDADTGDAYEADPMRPYAQLVGVESSQVPGTNRIEAGSPEDSYLYIKLGRGDQSVMVGDSMPPNNQPPLCKEKLDAVRDWIADGAPAE